MNIMASDFSFGDGLFEGSEGQSSLNKNLGLGWLAFSPCQDLYRSRDQIGSLVNGQVYIMESTAMSNKWIWHRADSL